MYTTPKNKHGAWKWTPLKWIFVFGVYPLVNLKVASWKITSFNVRDTSSLHLQMFSIIDMLVFGEYASHPLEASWSYFKVQVGYKCVDNFPYSSSHSLWPIGGPLFTRKVCEWNPQNLMNDTRKWWTMFKQKTSSSGWWFQIFFIFTPTWGNDPIWLIFFKWVGSTTN